MRLQLVPPLEGPSRKSRAPRWPAPWSEHSHGLVPVDFLPSFAKRWAVPRRGAETRSTRAPKRFVPSLDTSPPSLRGAMRAALGRPPRRSRGCRRPARGGPIPLEWPTAGSTLGGNGCTRVRALRVPDGGQPVSSSREARAAPRPRAQSAGRHARCRCGTSPGRGEGGRRNRSLSRRPAASGPRAVAYSASLPARCCSSALLS